jgi:hypothetical protein
VAHSRSQSTTSDFMRVFVRLYARRRFWPAPLSDEGSFLYFSGWNDKQLRQNVSPHISHRPEWLAQIALPQSPH